MRHNLTRGAYKPQGNNLGYTITNTTEYGLNSPQGNSLGHNPHPTRWNEKQKKMETKINMKQRNLKQEVDKTGVVQSLFYVSTNNPFILLALSLSVFSHISFLFFSLCIMFYCFVYAEK